MSSTKFYWSPMKTQLSFAFNVLNMDAFVYIAGVLTNKVKH